MSVTITGLKTPPVLHIFNRRFTLRVAILLLVLLMVCVSNLWKIFTLDMNEEVVMTNDDEEEKFRTTSRNCQPKHNVLFLKTHKTGSSTLTNILNRYGDIHNLTFALPQDGFYNFYWPLPFEKSFIKDTKGNQPNILCHHARWNKNPMKELMALDSVFITILRNPVTQFESTFSYMGFAHLFGIETGRDSIEAFITDPNGIMAKFANSSPAENVFPYLNLLKNGQFFDLGLDSIYFHDEEKVNMAIDEIARNFNLVLLMEYFDESLVLLANEACWDVRDVVYFKLNQRKSADKEDKFSNELVEKIRLWNRADVLLYDYFNKTFWNQIKKLGSAFKADVERLRYYNEVLMRESCLVPGEYNTKAYTKQARPVRGYALKENLDTPLKTLCEKMITNELDYLQLLTGRV